MCAFDANQPTDGDPAGGRSRSILLAEDTAANRQIVRRLLGQHGHQITVAENGQQAVEQFRQGKFDLIIMDLQMPVMDGYQATAEIRQLEASAAEHTPIVALTAHSTAEDREKCLAMGMDAYLAKPINMPELIRVVEQVGSDGDGAAGEDPLSAPLEIDLPATLKRLGGSQEIFRELVDLFAEDAPVLLETLEREISRSDGDAVYRAAHSLRGLAANFGAQQVMATAGELEQAARRGDLDQAAALRVPLAEQVERLIQQLRPLRDR